MTPPHVCAAALRNQGNVDAAKVAVSGAVTEQKAADAAVAASTAKVAEAEASEKAATPSTPEEYVNRCRGRSVRPFMCQGGAEGQGWGAQRGGDAGRGTARGRGRCVYMCVRV